MLTIDQVVKVLDAADMIEGWINSVRAYARELVDQGQEVGSYILVPKQARRRWKAEDPEAVAEELLLNADLTDEEVYERKLRSPAQIEKVLGAKRKHLIADLWTKESSGVNLVRSDKTERQALPPSAQRFFKTEPET